MPNGPRTGLQHKLYRNSGTYGSPVWNEVKVAKDVTLTMTKVAADAAARVSSIKQKLPNMKEIAVETEIVRDNTGTDYGVFEGSYWSDTTLDCAIADGTISTTGTEYFRSDWNVFDFTRKEPLENTVTNTLKLEPVYSANVPAFFTAP